MPHAQARVALAVLTCISAPGAWAGADEADEIWREHESRSAGLRFEIPAGAQVFERLIHTDASQPGTLSLRSLRVVPAGVSEERSLAGPKYVGIEVRELAAGEEPGVWLARLCDSPSAHRTLPQREVAGVPARLEGVSSAEGEFLRASFVLAGRVYRVSSGVREEDRRAFERVLETLAATPSEPAPPSEEATPREATVVPVVRMVYLVPSDRVLQPGYSAGLERTIRHLQSFYGQQIANGKTFLLNSPVVEVVDTGHPVSWYTTQHPGDNDFWNYVLADGFAALGGSFNDPNNRWIFYIDADQLCNQAVGGTSGVALMPANDLRGLLCQGNIPPCVGNPPDNGGVCRWVGGAGHEIGHSFNLPHPSGCDAGSCACPAPNTSCSSALMWTGYAIFPSAYLLPSDVNSLLTSPQTAQFFTLFDPGTVASPCTSGCPPARPTGLSASGSSSGISLTWNAVSGATSYRVRRGSASGGPYTQVASGLTSPSHLDTGAPVGTSYYVVTAVNAAGESGNSTEAAGTRPSPPTLQLLSPNGGESWAAGSVHPITWTSSGLDPAGSLQIYWAVNYGVSPWEWVASLAPTATSYSWTVPWQTTSSAVVFVGNAVDSVWQITDQSDQLFSVVAGAGRAGDYDGDGKADIAVFHPASRLWFVRQSSTGTTLTLGFGSTGDTIVPRDYDGDRKTDLAVYNPPSGLWFVRPSTTLSTYSQGYGGSPYKPVPADYDGDHKADIAVFHDPSGLWFVRESTTGNTVTVGFGASGYVPVPGDYDGDGKADLAVYHEASGLWYVRQSSTGTTVATGYGGTGYKPVPADYDGDGKRDLAVFHAATGLWFVRQSASGTTLSLGYGGSGSTPVPADYDGDGKADLAVYYESSGLWYVRQSSNVTTVSVGFGGTGYKPANQ